MRKLTASLPLLLLLCFSNPAGAAETPRSDMVIEKMSFKLARGVTNIATCIGEIPKQTYLTTRARGTTIGYVIGPMKGIGMTLYRGFTGIIDTVFFLVPQPGYYDPMIDPEFVWNGWDESDRDGLKQAEAAGGTVEEKGE